MIEQLPPQLFLGHEPRPNLIQPIQNRHRKPKGGLWTSSSYYHGVSGFMIYCSLNYQERLKLPVWELHPLPCRVFTVNSEQDLYQLPALPGEGRYSQVDYDWEAIARDWDALHLTWEGLREVASSYPRNLWSWDCESTLWFRWSFNYVESVAPTGLYAIGATD